MGGAIVTFEDRLRAGNRLLWTTVMAAATALGAAGCSSAVPGAQQTTGLFSSENPDDQAVRKRAEADKFPTAAQAGVASASSQP